VKVTKVQKSSVVNDNNSRDRSYHGANKHDQFDAFLQDELVRRCVKLYKLGKPSTK